MTNKEFYKDKIFEIACQGDSIAFDERTNKMVGCNDISCDVCKFRWSQGCKEPISKWLEEEYVEPPVDWSKVEVDTPILVKDSISGKWYKRYFAKYEGGVVHTFINGCTSWSVDDIVDNVSIWKDAKLYDDLQEIKNVKVSECDYDKAIKMLEESGIKIR